MVLIGVGLYLPYIVVHTTLFERLIAMTRERGNIGYLMYLADSFGYLGYVAVLLARNLLAPRENFLSFFVLIGWVIAGACVLLLVPCWRYFATHPAMPICRRAAARPGGGMGRREGNVMVRSILFHRSWPSAGDGAAAGPGAASARNCECGSPPARSAAAICTRTPGGECEADADRAGTRDRRPDRGVRSHGGARRCRWRSRPCWRSRYLGRRGRLRGVLLLHEGSAAEVRTSLQIRP